DAYLTLAAQATLPCSSGPIRSRRLGAPYRGSSIPGHALLPTTSPIMPPAAPGPPPPIACLRAMGTHGCRSRPAIRMPGAAHERRLLKSGRARGDSMKATRILHDLGQSLWLDNITRNLLRTGVLRRYIDEFSVTGLTSNPTIFDHAIKNSGDYDDAIKSKLAEGRSGEKLFF